MNKTGLVINGNYVYINATSKHTIMLGIDGMFAGDPYRILYMIKGVDASLQVGSAPNQYWLEHYNIWFKLIHKD